MIKTSIEQQFGSRVCQSEAAVNNARLPGYKHSKPDPQWTYGIQRSCRISHGPSIPGMHEVSSLPLIAEETEVRHRMWQAKTLGY